MALPRRLVLGLGMVFCLVSGCNKPTGKLTDVFGNEKNVQTVRSATSVTAYRLKSHDDSGGPSIDDYETVDGPVEVDDATTANLRKALLDPSAYGWGHAKKACVPNYGVRIDFQAGSEIVQVYFCFECQLLGVVYQGDWVGGEDFDDINTQLVAAVKKIFPDDAVIQALK